MIIKKSAPATAGGAAYCVTDAEVKDDYITLTHETYMNLVREAAMVHVAKNLIRNTKSLYDTGTLMRIVFGIEIPEEENNAV